MSQLEQNTTSLDEVLAMVNALPDAGGGGAPSLETCSFTFYSENPVQRAIQIYYLDGSMNHAYAGVSAFGNATLTVLKNSILVVHGYGGLNGFDGDCEILGDYQASVSIYVTGDCSVYG